MSSRTGEHVVYSPDTVLGRNVRVGSHVTFYPGVTVGDDATIYDGAVLGRPPQTAGNTTRPLDTRPRPLQIGAGAIVGAGAVVYGGTTIGRAAMVGDLAALREGVSLDDEAVVGRGVLVMYDATIGPRSRVIDGAILTGGMTVEADVFIGPGVRTTNDDRVYLARFGLAPLELKGPRVRRFALVGTGANLAAGVEIGAGAIVAPQAMVTRDVEPWTIVAGVPARPSRAVPDEWRQAIRERFKV